MNPNQPETILPALISMDNNLRNQAEALFNQLQQQHPDVCYMTLANVLRSSADAAVRTLCAVMLRKRLNDAELKKLNADTKKLIKERLLDAAQHEHEKSVRHKIADTLGEVASFILYEDENQWPEILPFLFQMCQSQSPEHIETGLNVFSTLVFDISDHVEPLVPNIKPIVLGCMNSNAPVDIQVAAVKVSCSIIQILGGTGKKRNELQDLLPPMMQALTHALNLKKEPQACNILEELGGVAEAIPQYYKPMLPSVLQVMMQLATSDMLEETTQHLAAEFVITLGEKAPAMMRKCDGYVAAVVGLGLKMMLHIEDIDIHEWNAVSDDADESPEEDETAEMGKEILDRIAIALGGKLVMPVLMSPQYLPAYFDHADWKYRQAGLHAIAQMAEGCDKQMKEDLTNIVHKVLSKFQDPDPRVRWAAINTMGQMETDLGPKLQKTCHAVVLPALAMVMDDHANPRVQSHAAAAVINFTEKCPRHIMERYIPDLVGKLAAMLRGASRHVYEQVITAVASIADCAEESFASQYDVIVPILKNVLHQCQGKEERKLRGKVIECISIIAVAVGKEKFAPDAEAFLQPMIHIQQMALDPDDPQISYLLQAWARLAKCLQEQFVPYLPIVMPSLLKSAALDMEQIEMEEEEDEEEEDHLSTAIVDGKRVGIRTSSLEEKATACNMLILYFNDLQEKMFPYVEQVAHIVVPLLRYAFFEEVRTAAAGLMSELVKCVKTASTNGACPPAVVSQYLTSILSELLLAISQETDLEVLLAQMTALEDTILVAGENSLSDEQLQAVLGCVTTIIKEAKGNANDNAERKKSEDFDEDEEEAMMEQEEHDEQAMDSAEAVVCALAKTHKSRFIPFFDAVGAEYFSMLGRDRRTYERRVGLCVFDDILEQLGPLGHHYYPHIIPIYLDAAVDPASEIRQASVYGLGVCAQHGAAAFVPFAAASFAIIQQLVQHPTARENENVAATDNAVSALGKMIEFQSPNLNFDVAISMFLSYLPFTGDLQEGLVVNSRLCGFLESNMNQILGHDYKWLQWIIKVLAEILETEQVDEEITKRIKTILATMQHSLPAAQLQHAYAALSEDAKAKLQRAMTA